MRIIILTSRFPFPLDKGDKLRAFHHIKQLSKLNEVHLISISDNKVTTKQIIELEKYCHSVNVFKLKKWKILINLFLGLFSNKPFQIKYFYQRAIHQKIKKLINKITPDHILCQLIRCVPYVQHEHHYSKTLDYMDAFSKGIERRIKNGGWLKQLLKIESIRLVKYENLAFEYFDHHCIISENDRSFIFHEKKESIKIITNGIDYDFFKPKKIEKKYDLVFIGNLSYAPNVDAALFIANELLPRLIKTNSQIKILINGANPTNQLLKLKNTNLDILGWTNDIRESYLSAKIFIAPMRIGTGLQNKLLEAMALNIPCITSELANQALKAKDGHQILIGNNPDQYIEHISNLLIDEQLRLNIGDEGRKYIRESFNWETTSKELHKLMFSQENTF